MLKLLKAITLMACMAVYTLFAPVATAGETLQRVIDFKVLKVGMSANQPPMTMVNRDGNLMGFDVDVATAQGQRPITSCIAPLLQPGPAPPVTPCQNALPSVRLLPGDAHHKRFWRICRSGLHWATFRTLLDNR